MGPFTRVVELAGLANGQTARAEDQHLLGLGELGHDLGRRKSNVPLGANGLTQRHAARERRANVGVTQALLVLAHKAEEVVKEIGGVLRRLNIQFKDE
jgi:hypothetical protein